MTHTVSEAESLAGDRSASGNQGDDDFVPALASAPTPCYSAGTGENTVVRPAMGSTCEVERDGVINFVVGVRLKF